jgi:DNA-binding NarL/FixJ family response regulator
MSVLSSADPIDLMVLDLSMPEPDGFEILKAVRSNRPELRILVISGWMGGALLKDAEFLGAKSSLDKNGRTQAVAPDGQQLTGVGRQEIRHTGRFCGAIRTRVGRLSQPGAIARTWSTCGANSAT